MSGRFFDQLGTLDASSKLGGTIPVEIRICAPGPFPEKDLLMEIQFPSEDFPPLFILSGEIGNRHIFASGSPPCPSPLSSVPPSGTLAGSSAVSLHVNKAGDRLKGTGIFVGGLGTPPPLPQGAFLVFHGNLEASLAEDCCGMTTKTSLPLICSFPTCPAPLR
ncbi:MAG TPA: hypothetical protein VKF62_00320 [Planctomycetota bacterium]|nr:hypothetical protein [Planctomycetota bacterium]